MSQNIPAHASRQRSIWMTISNICNQKPSCKTSRPAVLVAWLLLLLLLLLPSLSWSLRLGSMPAHGLSWIVPRVVVVVVVVEATTGGAILLRQTFLLCPWLVCVFLVSCFIFLKSLLLTKELSFAIVNLCTVWIDSCNVLWYGQKEEGGLDKPFFSAAILVACWLVWHNVALLGSILSCSLGKFWLFFRVVSVWRWLRTISRVKIRETWNRSCLWRHQAGRHWPHFSFDNNCEPRGLI